MSCALHSLDLPKPEPISVNGVEIGRETVAREAQHHPAAAPKAAFETAARALVIRELLLQEARRSDVGATPLRDDAGRRETEEEALIRSLIEQAIKTPEPDDATCRRYYEQNKQHFRSPDIFEAAHILISAPAGDAAAFQGAEAEAKAVLVELKLRPERFAHLARTHSACSSAAESGNLGQVTAGQTTPEFEAALFALEPGTISPAPIATRYGLHIIRLDRKIEGRELPFELVAERIADYLRENVTRRATAQYIARLVARADIRGVVMDGVEAHRVS
jgi:peptidyl-prolyl cis-trans isomerase C